MQGDDDLLAENTTDPPFRNHIPLGTLTATTGTYTSPTFSPAETRGAIIGEFTAGTCTVFLDTSPDLGTTWVSESNTTALATWTGAGNYQVSVGQQTPNLFVLGDTCRVRLVISAAVTGTLSFLEDSFST
jgi:hypothetical protein